MSMPYWKEYDPKKNREQGPKGVVVAGSSVTAGTLTVGLLVWVGIIPDDLPAGDYVVIAAFITTGAGYVVNRLRNFIKHA